MSVQNLRRCSTIFVIMASSVFGSLSAEAGRVRQRIAAAPLPTQQLNQNSRSSPVEPLRRWEIRTAPLAFSASWLTLDLSYRLNENFATGPAGVYYNASGETGRMFTPTFKGYALGWQGSYYLSSIQASTWYLGARGYYEAYRSYPHAFSGYVDKQGIRGSAVFGYQWKWSQVLLMTGLGGQSSVHDAKEVRNATSTAAGSTENGTENLFGGMIEVKLGYEF